MYGVKGVARSVMTHARWLKPFSVKIRIERIFSPSHSAVPSPRNCFPVAVEHHGTCRLAQSFDMDEFVLASSSYKHSRSVNSTQQQRSYTRL